MLPREGVTLVFTCAGGGEDKSSTVPLGATGCWEVLRWLVSAAGIAGTLAVVFNKEVLSFQRY